MIETLAKQSWAGSRREARVVCDGCGAATPFVDIGSASTAASTELARVRDDAGIEIVVGVADPKTVFNPASKVIERVAMHGDAPIRDFCKRCKPSGVVQ